MQYKDKVVIVTGCGANIGKGLALGFAKEGASIALADINEAEGTAAAEEIASLSGKSMFIQTDVTSIESVKTMVQEVRNTYGRIDILCNAVEVKSAEEIFDSIEKTWDSVIDINLKGAFFTSLEVGKFMAENNSGRIINISSTSAYITSSECMAAYDISKGGVRTMTTVLAQWLGEKGINVNSIAPGIKNASSDSETNHINNAAFFLCSDDASYINGYTMLVDFGSLMEYRENN